MALFHSVFWDCYCSIYLMPTDCCVKNYHKTIINLFLWLMSLWVSSLGWVAPLVSRCHAGDPPHFQWMEMQNHMKRAWRRHVRRIHVRRTGANDAVNLSWFPRSLLKGRRQPGTGLDLEVAPPAAHWPGPGRDLNPATVGSWAVSLKASGPEGSWSEARMWLWTQGAVSAESLWLHNGYLSRHCLHRINKRALTTLHGISKERPHFI